MMDILLFDSVLGKPGWMWLVFLTVITILLVLDLGVLHRKNKEIGIRESLLFSAGYIAISLLFGLWVWWELGSQEALEYYTGYIIEKSLSMDNIFVMAIIFAALHIPRIYQHRVLFWGILGVILMRGVMIGVGAALVHEFGWLLYVFGAFLIFTGIKLLFIKEGGDHSETVENNPIIRYLRKHFRVTEKLHGQKFFTRIPHEKTGRKVLYITPLLLALITIEAADLVFAVDSVPAIFAITTDTYIIYTSNIFAILGLRALYFALSAMIERFAYLKYSLALILIFIGAKVFVPLLTPLEKVPAEFSLGITVGLLAAGVFYSLHKTGKDLVKR
ncbi:MAG: TerC family protein [Alphaproteobacteria bacterium]|nr:TerC family protein [Alphaproteobacteria bacterium]